MTDPKDQQALRKQVEELTREISASRDREAASAALLEQERAENSVLLRHLRDMTTLAAASTSTKNEFRMKMIDVVDEFLETRIPQPDTALAKGRQP